MKIALISLAVLSAVCSISPAFAHKVSNINPDASMTQKREVTGREAYAKREAAEKREAHMRKEIKKREAHMRKEAEKREAHMRK